MSNEYDSGEISETNDTTETTDTSDSVEVTESDIGAAFDTLEPADTAEKPDDPGDGKMDVETGPPAETDSKSPEADLKADHSKELPSYDTLSSKEITAISTNPAERTWRQTEMADAARNNTYSTQKSYMKDANGNLIETSYGTKGSLRPDEIKFDENGRADIREVKDYHDVNNLLNNIDQQAQQRYETFGEDANLTFAMSVNDFTVEDAARIQDHIENDLHANVDWINK